MVQGYKTVVVKKFTKRRSKRLTRQALSMPVSSERHDSRGRRGKRTYELVTGSSTSSSAGMPKAWGRVCEPEVSLLWNRMDGAKLGFEAVIRGFHL